MSQLIAATLILFAPMVAFAQTAPALVQRSYPVADLVVPLERVAIPRGASEDATPDVSMGPRFVQLIVSTIEPRTWREGGGPGIVEFVPTTKTLVVSQPEAVHQKVAGLLADLRQSQDVLVEVEVRLLDVTECFFEHIGVDFNVNIDSNVNAQTQSRGRFAESRPTYSEEDLKAFKTLRTMSSTPETMRKPLEDQTFLNDRQLRGLLDAVQGDRRTNITQAPKFTLLNGQTGTIFVGETQFFCLSGDAGKAAGGNIVYSPQSHPIDLGVRITTQPVASPDRRLVNLYLKVEEKELGLPTTGTRELERQRRVLSRELEKTLAIPVGQTAVLLGGRRVVECRNEYGPPILSKIPYVNRYFKNVGYGRESMLEFVLVTPRIVPLDGTPAPNEAAVKRGYEHLETLAPCSRITDMTKPDARSEQGKALLRELEPAPSRPSDVVAVLQKAYLQARAEGRVEEAEKLARALRDIDPNIKLQR
jgi:general secretion pathway protein D